MNGSFKRRRFLTSLFSLPLLASSEANNSNQERNINTGKSRLKMSLNAFSFNDPLMDKSMTLENMLETCSEIGFDGVDITAYYFPGYPMVPEDNYLYHIKQKAFRLGLDITGTGVRNDFTEPDLKKRSDHVALVKAWVDAAAKLGAPVVRIFAGTQNPAGYERRQILEWMLRDIKECVSYGKKNGVIVAIQNHNDFIQTAAQANEFIEKIDSEWFGLILDTGSYRVHDPYEEIEKSAKYAVNWQIKEHVFMNGAEVPADIPRLIRIIKDTGYKGYIPIETLGPGDPKHKVSFLFNQVKKAIG